MIGKWTVWASFLRRRTTSQQSASGISRSIRMMSGRSVNANLQPCSLSLDARTSKSPTCSRRILSMYRLSSSCSMYSTLITWPVPDVRLVYLLNHLGGPSEQGGRHFEPNRLGRLEVDYQFVLSRMLNSQVGWLLAPEDAIDIA